MGIKSFKTRLSQDFPSHNILLFNNIPLNYEFHLWSFSEIESSTKATAKTAPHK